MSQNCVCSALYLTFSFLCYRCNTAANDTTVQGVSESGAWESSIKLSANHCSSKPLWVRLRQHTVRYWRTSQSVLSTKTTSSPFTDALHPHSLFQELGSFHSSSIPTAQYLVPILLRVLRTTCITVHPVIHNTNRLSKVSPKLCHNKFVNGCTHAVTPVKNS